MAVFLLFTAGSATVKGPSTSELPSDTGPHYELRSPLGDYTHREYTNYSRWIVLTKQIV